MPSDLSSAAFFLVAALLVPGADLYIRGVGLNPTRSALLDFLSSAGANVRIESLAQINGELIGNLRVRHSAVRGGVIEKDLTAALIDEIPVLAVLGAASEEGLTIRDAGELRMKETDRIATVAENFRRMGIEAQETPDGMVIPGKQKFHAATCDSFGDHRIAMAFSVAALAADGPTTIENSGAASVSFPEFFNILSEVSEIVKTHAAVLIAPAGSGGNSHSRYSRAWAGRSPGSHGSLRRLPFGRVCSGTGQAPAHSADPGPRRHRTHRSHGIGSGGSPFRRSRGHHLPRLDLRRVRLLHERT